MKPIKNGVTKITHPNAGALYRDRYSEKITSTPQRHYSEDISPDATNVISGTTHRHLLPVRPSVSRNMQPPRPMPRQAQSRSSGGKFSGRGEY